MKARIAVLTLSALLFSMPVHGVITDTQATATGSVWATVKVKVDSWLRYWNGSDNLPTPVNTAVVAPVPTKSVKKAASQVSGPTPLQTESTAAPRSAPVRPQAIFPNKTPGSSLKEVQAARDTIKASPLLKVTKPARAGVSKLAKSKTTGVPVSDFKRLKVTRIIPRLDIGTDTLISREDFAVSSLHWGAQTAQEIKRLPQAQAVSDGQIHALTRGLGVKALGKRGVQATLYGASSGKPLTLEQVNKTQYTVLTPPEFTVLPYKPLSEDQLKMVAALILFDKGSHCHMIMGLFHQLANSPNVRNEANYHLGACAADLHMYQSAFDNLSKVIATEDKDFAADALGILAKGLPLVYEKDFYTLLKSLKNPKKLLGEKYRSEVAYRMAKGAYRAKDFKTSALYATQVERESSYYQDARFLVAMNDFAMANKAGALKTLQELAAELALTSAGDSNIRALVSVNLARMYFAANKYDKALEQYMKVPKDHPLWVQALTEQGWTQLAMEDYSGAIGNMYSLHSPYFKSVYQPESFVVRTVGYLSICQYGDAYKSLSWLEKDYRDWYGKTSHYLENKGTAADVYGSVKNYIRGKSTEDVEGVPFQVWREMAHRKDFLNIQTALNDKQDEARRYEGVNKKIKVEKVGIRAKAEEGKKRFDYWRAQIARVQNNTSLRKNLPQMQASLKTERDQTISYRFQLAILEQSRQGYLDFQNKSQRKLDEESVSLSGKAGTALLTHARNMEKEMARVLDNNEFLRYEVFSGSGENIRYQVAGGKVDTTNRVPASIKPTKMMNWSFDGEYWEDEIGSYRSSLQNNCPMTQQARKAERVPSEQARQIDDEE